MGVERGRGGVVAAFEGSFVCADADAAESDTSSTEAEAWAPTMPLVCGAVT